MSATEVKIQELSTKMPIETNIEPAFELPEEIQQMREKVVSYLKSKVTHSDNASAFEEAIFKNTMKKTTLNEIKTLKYEIFKHRYNYRLQVIVLNIKELENNIMNKIYSIDDIFNKNPMEIFPDKWEESVKRLKEEEKFLYETHLVANCKTLCFKCKEQNIYSTHKQTRSADEPETIFYLCLSCGNKWKT